jgi:hypothetical protein
MAFHFPAARRALLRQSSQNLALGSAVGAARDAAGQSALRVGLALGEKALRTASA